LDSISLYLRYVGVSIRSQMQYRGSFLMQTFGDFFITAVEFFGLWALFQRFDQIQGWTLPEVALFYGVVSVSFAIADAISAGFDRFSLMVRGGDFDRLLVRPRSTALQLAGQELTLRRLGRFAQGFAVLLWASTTLDLDWTADKIALLCFAISAGAALFFGMFIIGATLCFWTVESLEMMNVFTYGGVEMGHYPLTIYRSWFRSIFTFGIPLACVCYFPVVGVLGRPDPLGSPVWVQYVSPLAGFVFLFLCLRLWRFGVRHYTSTGS